jgi:hypothetical protein
MTIEIRPCQPSLGYQRQRWPKTRHHVLRIGTREVRAIVWDGESVRPLGIVALVLASFFTQ